MGKILVQRRQGMATKKAATSKDRRGRRKKERDDDFDYSNKRNPFSNYKMPWFGWLGLAIMILSEIALWVPRNPLAHPVAVAFTPIMWTGYILLVDGWIWARGYYSYFKNAKREWPMLALFSVLIWVMFEVFNFPARAWSYNNMPTDLFVKDVVFAWAYATIIPALLRTRSLFATFDFFDRTHHWNFKFTPMKRAVFFVVGLALTFIPPMFKACTPEDPFCTANLLIPLVWLGFIFMIEPINYRIGAPSVLRDLERPRDREIEKRDLHDLEKRQMRNIEKPGGRKFEERDITNLQKREQSDKGKISFFWQVLTAGLICGLLWETWNIQAFWHNGLIWDYHLNPIYHIHIGGHDVKIGRMPILGFLGYPPFIWECFALWELVKWAMHGDILWKARLK
jgi:hypothetical protein